MSFSIRPHLILAAALGCAIVATLASSPARAQDKGKSAEGGWVRQFDSVTVDRVEPGDLPQTAKPGEKIAIRTKADELPRPATKEELEKMVDYLAARVVQVVSVRTPPRPYRQVPTVHFGHALWLAASDGKPRLVTTLNWLQEADDVYVIPPALADEASDEAGWKSVRKRTLASMTAGEGGKKWLEEHQDELVAVEPARADKHRNLVTLSADEDALSPPAKGLPIFEADKSALFRAYGYTPFFGKSLIQTTLLPTHPEQAELAFFLQTSFPAILGAPLVSQDGKLVAINAFRHPQKEKVFLAVPAGAIAGYLAAEEDDE